MITYADTPASFKVLHQVERLRPGMTVLVRTKDDAEVDLILDRAGQRPLFVEIKSAETVTSGDVKNLIDMARDGEADAMVLCRTPRPYQLGTAEVLPWQTGLKQIFGL